MKPLLLIAGFYAAISLVVFWALGLCRGGPDAAPIAILRQDVPGQTNEERGLTALLETSRFALADKPQLILLGASVAAGAYLPAVVQPKLPGFTVSNLAMPGAAMTEIMQIFDEVAWAAPKEVLRKSVLVIAVSYTSFCPDVVRYANVTHLQPAWWAAPQVVTNVLKAADRSPLILSTGHPMRAVAPRWLLLAAKQRLRRWVWLRDFLPFHPGTWLSQRAAWRRQTQTMRRAREAHETAFPKPKPILEWFLELPVKEQTEWVLREWGKTGTLVDQVQLDRLSLVLDRALSEDMTVVIVDLPLHGEHRRHAPVLGEFRARLSAVIAPHAARGGVHLIDLTEAIPDDAFGDLAHADPDAVETWVDLLIDRLRPLLPDRPPQASR